MTHFAFNFNRYFYRLAETGMSVFKSRAFTYVCARMRTHVPRFRGMKKKCSRLTEKNRDFILSLAQMPTHDIKALFPYLSNDAHDVLCKGHFKRLSRFTTLHIGLIFCNSHPHRRRRTRSSQHEKSAHFSRDREEEEGPPFSRDREEKKEEEEKVLRANQKQERFYFKPHSNVFVRHQNACSLLK